ncbi:MAG: hypothetical protein AB7T49_17255 [Oligoflexales bacterium]
MRRFIRLSLVIAILGACVTSPEPVYRFPKTFEAVQAVTFSGSDKTMQLLAQVSRSANKTEVLFLEPLSQRPLLRLSNVGEDSSQKWFIDPAQYHIDSFDFLQVLALIDHIYKSPAFKHPSEYGLLQLEGGDNIKDIQLTEFVGEGACLMPKSIKIFWETSEGFVDINTKEVSCPD